MATIETFWGLVNRYLLGVQALYWGYLALISFSIWATLIIKNNLGFKSLIIGLYLVSAGSYLFVTGMVDRYFFPATIFLTILVFYYPKLFKWWIATLVVYSVNLFYSWGYPFLNDLTAWKNPLIIRIFSFLNLLIFWISISEMGLLKDARLKIKEISNQYLQK